MKLWFGDDMVYVYAADICIWAIWLCIYHYSMLSACQSNVHVYVNTNLQWKYIFHVWMCVCVFVCGFSANQWSSHWQIMCQVGQTKQKVHLSESIFKIHTQTYTQ